MCYVYLRLSSAGNVSSQWSKDLSYDHRDPNPLSCGTSGDHTAVSIFPVDFVIPLNPSLGSTISRVRKHMRQTSTPLPSSPRQSLQHRPMLSGSLTFWHEPIRCFAYELPDGSVREKSLVSCGLPDWLETNMKAAKWRVRGEKGSAKIA